MKVMVARLTALSFYIICFLLFTGCARSAPPADGQAPEAARTPDYKVINEHSPGEALNLPPHIVSGKYTVVSFHSRNCDPSSRMEPLLEKLAAARPDVAVRTIDIDRPGKSGIDFDSPVAEEFGITRVPWFIIYSQGGKFWLKDREAKEQVKNWMVESKIVRSE